MGMQVKIVHRETVKPSSPTPESHRYYKLSLLDQTAPNGYIPIVLFYSHESSQDERQLDHLKESLSKALTYMYPLAGRVKDAFTIECNDKGVDFIEACVADQDMAMVLQHPKIDTLRQLLPCNPETALLYDHDNDHPSGHGAHGQVLLAVQINKFSCGGLAIGVCINHIVADGSSLASFLIAWARINSQEQKNVGSSDDLVIDCSAMFPPMDINGGFSMVPLNQDDEKTPPPPKIASKRFVFDGSKIAALVEKAATDNLGSPPSRVEAVTAFVWSAVIASMQKRSNNAIKKHVLLTAVNLRKRMKPSLPTNSIGNIFHVTEAHCDDDEVLDTERSSSVDYKLLVTRVRESLRKVQDSYVRKMHDDYKYLDFIRSQFDEMLAKNNDVGVFKTSSMCRFPFYEVDLGWGKPIWVGNVIRAINVGMFMDTKDNRGIEAWVVLEEQDMHLLDHNLDFLSYVSLNQSV